MDNLENRILKERDGLDSFEPSQVHMDRFAGKLSRQQSNFLTRIPFAVKVAAVLLLVATSGILVYEQIQLMNSENSIIATKDKMSEISDVEFYYTSQIAEKHDEIARFSSHDPEQNKILLNELKTMDDLFTTLQDDMQVNPNDERIINALIIHYEIKLEVMAQILKQLESANNIIKINQDEDIEI